MCGSEAEYDTCWNRVCNPDRSNVLRDVLKGLLVLIALAIVITVIFLLCYFLLNDIEHKEEEVVDDLIKDFSLGNRIDHAEPEFAINDGHGTSPKDGEIYNTGGLFGGDLDSLGTAHHSGSGGSARLQKAKANDVLELSTPTNENANDRIFNVDGDQSSLPQEGLSPFRTTVDSDISNPDGLLADVFLPDTDISNPQYDVITEFVDAEHTTECVPLRLPLCAGTMPWALTAFPNFVNNNNFSELKESLKYFQSTIIGSRCSPRAAQYSCAILEPSCGPDSVPLPPCRAFCKDIVSTCSEFFITGNEHNSAFLCSRFPDSTNPNVCVDINRAPSNVTDPPTTDFDDNSSKDMQNAPDINSTTTDGPETTSFTDILKIGATQTSDSPLPEPVTEAIEKSEIPQEKATNDDQSPNQELVEREQAIPREKPAEPAFAREKIAVNVAEPHNVTEPPEYFICDNTKFICEDGSDCLDYASVCDGIQHCLDNTDELNCTKPETETLTTPFELLADNEDTQGQATTELIIIAEDNADNVVLGTETSENLTAPKRFSLSDMLSSSALVANPKVVPASSSSPKLPKEPLRFGPTGSASELKVNKGKAFDSSSLNSDRNTFSSFGPFPFTAKPIQLKEKKAERENSSTKMSLAALLSSSSLAKITPRPSPTKKRPQPIQETNSPPLLTKVTLRPPLTKISPRSLLTKGSPRPLLRKLGPRPSLKDSPRPLLVKSGPRPLLTKATTPIPKVLTSTTTNSSILDAPIEEPLGPPPVIPSGRSLSALLSSSLPSFSSPVSSRHSPVKCKELQCIDGTCISMKQLGDGIVDCPDGSDEKQGNHISLK